jgi:predicted nuclease with TOPRIM domain
MTAKIEQLLLFDLTPQEKLRQDFDALKESTEKVRKGQFAKISANQKQINDVKERLEILERGICQSDIEERFRDVLAENISLKQQMDDLQHDFHQLKSAFLPLASIFERKYEPLEQGVKAL